MLACASAREHRAGGGKKNVKETQLELQKNRGIEKSTLDPLDTMTRNWPRRVGDQNE